MKHALCLFVAFFLFGASKPEETVLSPNDRLAEAALSLSYAKSAKGDTDRLKAIMADAYAEAEATVDEKLLFEGDAAKEAQALLLYAILYNESGMRPHVERCDCTHGDGDCDNGEAAGLSQVHVEHFQGHTKEEICADRKLQIALAGAVLARKKTMCGTVPLTIGAYNAGGCTLTDYATRGERVFQILLRTAKIDVRQQGRQWVATPRREVATR